MANVIFKRGTHSTLPSDPNKIIDGAFYLTTDTNRLYVGQSVLSSGQYVNKLVELNKSITTVNTKDELPSSPNVAEGHFYFVKNANALCWYGVGQNPETGATETRWWQINPDTTLNSTQQGTTIKSIKDGEGATITTSFEDTAKNTVTGYFDIVGDDATSITAEEVDIKNANGDTIHKKGVIKVSSHDTETTLSTETNTTKGVLVSYEDKVTKSTINFNGGSNVTVSSDNAGNIEIDAADMYNTGADLSFDGDGKLTVTVSDGAGSVSGNTTPTISYGDGKTAVFAGGTAALDVYDKEQVNSLLKTADALVFKGIIDAKKIPSITTAQNGDVYKINANTDNDTTYNIGDLIIASGKEDATTNKIKEGEWIVIPSGDDQVISGTTTKDTHSWTVNDQSGEIVGQTLKDGGENIKLSSTVSNGHITTTISHDVAGQVDSSKTVTGSTSDVTQTAEQTAEFTAVTQITRDTNGHVVDVTTKKFTVRDTHNGLSSLTVEASGNTNTSNIGGTTSIKTTVSDIDGNTKDDNFNITSQTLNLTASNTSNQASINIDLIWGSFPS